ncbi:transglutaminase domain-containing protein [Lactiplantibacillus sp. WILCCON 0030]|uniref:Transglutaminase domain-containing protein n=1 Tax=Lactiplantibacillus brownii TaxID=3069269 RepID=A0ABU1AAZ8_9LACO|nr:transglutaminase domain-containing protein [Lactiplantibacillus brownii]MDQ7938104.1 transglutaminase domain-containing protein [Lactiplantibacillus brownii]
MPTRFESLLTALLHTGLLTIPLLTYTTVNDFQQPWLILVFLATINTLILLGTWWPRLDLIWISLILVSFIGSCYVSTPLNQTLSLTWANRFIAKLSQQTSAFQASRSTQMMPVLLSMVLIMALVIALTLLTVRWQQPFLSILISVGYLLAVAIFATRNEVLPLTGVSALTGLLLVVHYQSRWTWTNLIYVSLLLVIVGAGATVNTWGQQPLKRLAQQTLTWRNTLSSRGFYNFLEKSAAAKKTGFSEDTATLGGSIQDDNQVAFRVIASQSHYWRVDTRDTYSGQGWEVEKDTQIKRKPTWTSSGYTQSPTAATQTVQLTFPKTMTYVPISYGQTTWRVSQAQQKRHGIGYASQRGRLYVNLGKTPLTKITYQLQTQQYTAAQLKAATGDPNAELDDSYTTLPDELPKRVKTLSQKLTQTAPTQYAKVQALMTYLKQDNRFEYTKIDTPTTPKGRDYVDYFLFTSRRGYCDNFSTSLVVMLRELNIPARWAQGFNGGTRGQATKSGRYHYSILNSNAHSWAEVYFAGIGWVPFDPTPGYQNPGVKKNAAKATTNQDNRAFSTSSSSTSSSFSSQSSVASSHQSASESTHTTTQKAPQTLPRWLWSVLLISLLICGLVSGWLARYRLWLVLITWRIRRHWRTTTTQYQQLQHWFERQYPRQPSTTLTNYATQVEAHWPQLAGQFSVVTQQVLQQSFGQTPVTTLSANLLALIQTLQKNPKPIAP